MLGSRVLDSWNMTRRFFFIYMLVGYLSTRVFVWVIWRFFSFLCFGIGGDGVPEG